MDSGLCKFRPPGFSVRVRAFLVQIFVIGRNGENLQKSSFGTRMEKHLFGHEVALWFDDSILYQWMSKNLFGSHHVLTIGNQNLTCYNRQQLNNLMWASSLLWAACLVQCIRLLIMKTRYILSLRWAKNSLAKFKCNICTCCSNKFDNHIIILLTFKGDLWK